MEHNIRVPETPLPDALTSSSQFAMLSDRLRSDFLGHVRYMQEVPFKLQEWVETGSRPEELRALVLRIDLDISIHIGIPDPAQMEISAHALRELWAGHDRPLSALLKQSDATALDMTVPKLGASLSALSEWIAEAARALSGLFEGFFGATKFDVAMAYLVSIHVFLSGIKFGLGRVDLQYPSHVNSPGYRK